MNSGVCVSFSGSQQLSRAIAGALATCFVVVCLAGAANAEERKRKAEVKPQYPELARGLNLSGTVRLEAEVAPDGKVRNVKVLGGHPVLVRAAVEAVKQWKYEVAQTETTEPVEIHFTGIQ
jgi:TonB family protein